MEQDRARLAGRFRRAAEQTAAKLALDEAQAAFAQARKLRKRLTLNDDDPQGGVRIPGRSAPQQGRLELALPGPSAERPA